jgi:hypothetical protein
MAGVVQGALGEPGTPKDASPGGAARRAREALLRAATSVAVSRPVLRGAPAGHSPWTEAEDAVLLAVYAQAGATEASRSLPTRTRNAIFHRARELGLSRRARWTPSEDRSLTNLWEDGRTVGFIAQKLGRSPLTIYWRATVVLGLHAGVPPGYEYLSHAAARTGYSPAQLRRILEAEGVRMRRVLCRPGRAPHHRHFVDPCEVDDAIASWVGKEPVTTAARRLGIDPQRLRRRLVRIGVQPPAGRKHMRVTEEEIRRANEIAIWGRRHRRAA